MHHGDIDIHTAQGLEQLRKRIEAEKIPSSKLDETINVATWNIREFGKKPRLKSAIHFIAEILGQFDLIAITELRNDLSDMKRVMEVLGPYWKIVYSDYIADHGGNNERVGYLYDQRAVTFTGLAAEADAPRKKNPQTGEYLEQLSWWRRPYIASFRSGSFDFVLITAHIRWGDGAAARIAPLKLLAEWMEKKRKDPFTEDKDIILMGDFNIPKKDDDLYNAITSTGLQAPDAIRGLKHGSNLAKDKRYDQILHFPTVTDNFTNKAGVLDFYCGDHSPLFPAKQMTKEEFTYQLSDHLPLWIQMNVDIEGLKLDQILNR